MSLAYPGIAKEQEEGRAAGRQMKRVQVERGGSG